MLNFKTYKLFSRIIKSQAKNRIIQNINNDTQESQIKQDKMHYKNVEIKLTGTTKIIKDINSSNSFDQKRDHKQMHVKKNLKQQETLDQQDILGMLIKYEDLHQKLIPSLKDPQILINLIKQMKDISSFDYEKKYFKNFSFLIGVFVKQHKQILEKMNQEQLIDLLLNYSQLQFKHSEIFSSKTIQFTKKCLHEITKKSNEEIQIQKVLDLLEIFANLKHSDTHKLKVILDHIQSHISNFNLEQILLILSFLNQLKWKNFSLLEIIADKIFPQMQQLEIKQLALVLIHFQNLDMRLNKHFLYKSSQVLSQKLIESKEFNVKHALMILSALPRLEKKYTNHLFFIDELNPLYEICFDIIKSNMKSFKANELGNIANNVQRCHIYNPQFLDQLIDAVIQKDLNLDDFQNDKQNFSQELQSIIEQQQKVPKDSQKYRVLEAQRKSKEIELQQNKKKQFLMYTNIEVICKIVHCLAVYNHQSDKFIQYASNVLEIYHLKFQIQKITLNNHYLARGAWGFCALESAQLENHDISLSKKVENKSNTIKSVAILIDFFNGDKNYDIQPADVGALFMVFKYLKNRYDFNQTLVQNTTEIYAKMTNQIPKKISMLCMDITRVLEIIQIPHSLEVNIDNLLVDIIVPNFLQKQGKQVDLLLDIHGYHHFLRNDSRIKGHHYLKQSILQEKGYIYAYIPAHEWQLLSDQHKQFYIQELFKKIYETNINKF